MSVTSPQAKKQSPVFRYVEPAKRRATQYEEVTLHTQWSPSTYARQGWFCRDGAGNGAWRDKATKLECPNWWSYRDPAQMWHQPYVERQASQEDAIETATEAARLSGALADIDPDWMKVLGREYAAYRFFEYGLFLALCYVQREAPSDVIATPVVFQSMDRDRHAQAIALFCMDLEESVPGFSEAEARPAWMTDPVLQPSREYVERLMAARDWGEIIVATNLVLDPLVSTLFTRRFAARTALRRGDPVTPTILDTVEIDRRRNLAATEELLRVLLAADERNRATVQSWIATWEPRALAAAGALEPLFERFEAGSFGRALELQRGEYRAFVNRLGLETSEGGIR
jgi:hypothetical protein